LAERILGGAGYQGSHREADSVAMSLYSRRQAIVAAAGFTAFAALAAKAQNSNVKRSAILEIDIKRNGSRPSTKGSSDWFTGAVRVDPLFQAPDPGRVSCGQVTFEPGARTAWHTHPLGQTLVVTAGLGWVRREGGPIEEIRAGDVVWFPPSLKHWHGATPTTAMTHIAIQESVDGKNVDWLEKVADDQYRK
jgi:quercetin dioxygenase-like cupin family protein